MLSALWKSGAVSMRRAARSPRPWSLRNGTMASRMDLNLLPSIRPSTAPLHRFAMCTMADAAIRVAKAPDSHQINVSNIRPFCQRAGQPSTFLCNPLSKGETGGRRAGDTYCGRPPRRGGRGRLRSWQSGPGARHKARTRSPAGRRAAPSDWLDGWVVWRCRGPEGAAREG